MYCENILKMKENLINDHNIVLLIPDRENECVLRPNTGVSLPC